MNGIVIQNNAIKTDECILQNIAINANSYTEINTVLPLTKDGMKIMSAVFICNLDAIVCSFSTSNYSGLKVTAVNTAPVAQTVDITVRALYA